MAQLGGLRRTLRTVVLSGRVFGCVARTSGESRSILGEHCISWIRVGRRAQCLQAPLHGCSAWCARQAPPHHGRRVAHEPAGQHLRWARLSRAWLPQEPLARTRVGYDPYPSVPQGESSSSSSNSEHTHNAGHRRTSPPESSSSRASGARSRTCPARRATPRSPTPSLKTCLALVSGGTRHPSVPAWYRSRLRQVSRMRSPVVAAAAAASRRLCRASGARYTPPRGAYALCTTYNSMLTLRGTLVEREQRSQEHESSFIHIPLLIREGLRLVLFGYGFLVVLLPGWAVLMIERTALVKTMLETVLRDSKEKQVDDSLCSTRE